MVKRDEVAERVKELLTFTFPSSVRVESTWEDGNLVIVATWPYPLPGRPHAAGKLHVIVTEEAVEDRFSREELTDNVNAKFRSIILDRMAHFVPSPPKDSEMTPEPEVWIVRSSDLR